MLLCEQAQGQKGRICIMSQPMTTMGRRCEAGIGRDGPRVLDEERIELIHTTSIEYSKPSG